MYILYIGNFLSNNGPSMVDKSLVNISNTIYPLQATTKLISFSDLKAILKCDICHVSAVSTLGLILAFVCKSLGKKVTFTMHGTLKAERKFRKISPHRLFVESMLVHLSNKIFVVSDKLSKIVKSLYNSINSKLITIPNGVTCTTATNIQKKPNTIVCIGGGRKEKRVLDVCKAVYKLNSKGEKIKINVFGEDSLDTKDIKKYDFVHYYGFVPQEILLSMLAESYLFIQYSEYEPFSLSIFDAIVSNCNIITSDNVGAIDYLTKADLHKISIVKDINELTSEIERQLASSIASYSNYENLSWENTYHLYMKNWDLIKNA